MNGESNAIATVEAPAQSMVHLVARNPVEMQNAQTDLKAWLHAKLSEVETDIRDLNAAIHEAKNQKWSSRALETQRNKAVAREEFYFKILKAVEAGYTIVPDFPVDVFAIRVIRDEPVGGSESSHYKRSLQADREPPDIVQAGYGHYVSPIPKTEITQAEVPDGPEKTKTLYTLEPTTFRDVVFPVRAARVEVMNATAEAMALQVFDQIGICPPERKADPLILGQIILRDTSRAWWQQKRVSFILAWHLNLNEL